MLKKNFELCLSLSSDPGMQSRGAVEGCYPGIASTGVIHNVHENIYSRLTEVSAKPIIILLQLDSVLSEINSVLSELDSVLSQLDYAIKMQL